MFEKLDGEYDRAYNNHALFKNKAFAAWSEYNIQGQWRADVISGEDSDFETRIESSTRDTSSFINGTLAAFCDSEYTRIGWWSTTIGSYSYKSKVDLSARGAYRLDS